MRGRAPLCIQFNVCANHNNIRTERNAEQNVPPGRRNVPAVLAPHFRPFVIFTQTSETIKPFPLSNFGSSETVFRLGSKNYVSYHSDTFWGLWGKIFFEFFNKKSTSGPDRPEPPGRNTGTPLRCPPNPADDPRNCVWTPARAVKHHKNMFSCHSGTF